MQLQKPKRPQLHNISTSCTKFEGQLRDKPLRPITATDSQVAAATTRTNVGRLDSHNGIGTALDVWPWDCRLHKLPASQGSIDITPDWPGKLPGHGRPE